MSKTEPKTKKLYFENLDGLRFFCFLLVFFYHSFTTELPHIAESAVHETVKKDIFGNGFLGVNFFFVLSGFLITYLLIEEKKLRGKINIPNFWLRRILRIWPLYFACIFIGFVAFPFAKSLAGGVPQESANIWYYLTFINNFDYIKTGLPDAPGLGVLWSIAIEEQFYLIWPVILAFIPVRHYWIAFLTIILGSLTFRALNDVPILHEMHTLSCIGDMATGAFGAWLYIERKSFTRFIEQLPRTVIIIIYLLLAAIFLFRDEFLLETHLVRVFERLITATTILMVILEQCFSKNSFYKMASLKSISKLGIYTYGLYCLHFIFISAVQGVTRKLGWNTELWQVLFLETAISLTITIIVAKLSYKYFESPFLRLKDRFGYILKK